MPVFEIELGDGRIAEIEADATQEEFTAWSNSAEGQQTILDSLAVEDNRQNEEVAEQGGYEVHDVSAIWDSLTMDGDARMEAVSAAANASVPTEVQEVGPNGETVVRETTLDEQETIRQQAMWDSLNPVQQGLISIGRGVEDAWDIIGLGTVDDAKETVLDGVESGQVNDVLQFMGTLAEVGGTAGGTVGGVKLLIGGLKNHAVNKGRGVLDFFMRALAQSKERVGKDVLNQSADLVLNTPKGAATAKVMATAPDEGTAIKAGELIMEKIDVVAEPLMRANNIRNLDPELAAKVAQKRIMSQKAATKKLHKEMEDAQQAVRDHAKSNKARQDALDLEATLGLRGQAKRYQAGANRAAAKKLPGGF